MSPSKPLSPKQQRFVAEYLKDLNATQAAIRAGYSAKHAEKNSVRLTGNHGIARAIQAGTARHLAKAEATAQRTIEELRRVSYFDLGKLFDKHGKLKPIRKLSPAVRAGLASVEVVRQNLTAGDGSQEWVHKVKVWDKIRALEALAKHFGLLTEKIEHSGGIEIRWKDGEE